jgi:peroxiredoxin
MKNLTFVLVSFFVLICSCTSHKDKIPKKFTLNGEFNSQDTGIIFLQYVSDTILINDTTEIKNGKFRFSGKILEPTRAALFGRNYLELARIYIEPEKMNIIIFKDKPYGSKMTGSKTQSEYDELIKMEEPIYNKLNELRKERTLINESLNASQNENTKLLLQGKLDKIDSLYPLILDRLNPIEVKFVLENPHSFVTLNYLPMLISRDLISLDSLKSIFNGLDPSLKASKLSKYIIEDIRKNENVKIGHEAPDFKATTLNQKSIRLSQFKGTGVVIMDFWASWCVPCRKSIPHLKAIYNKYHFKGLEVVAVSVDENKTAWIDAVKQDSTDMWHHVLIAEKWPNRPFTNDDIFQNYYYKAIPTQFIIDKNGKIISQFVGYSKENEASLDSLLYQLFK